MASGSCIIVGAGSIGLQLIKNLSREFDLICIDPDTEALEAVRRVREQGLKTLAADATSRLALEEAGTGEASTVVITTSSEKVNLEVARVVQTHFQVPRVISIGITPGGIATLEELGVEVEGIFSVSATGLRNRLEQKTKTVHGIGLGKNEILEVEVHSHSRLTNKPLAFLNPKNWRIGIVYREGNIIIPVGDTVLRPRDRVILLGDPGVLKTVAEMLTFRFTRFPLEYGDTLAAYCPGMPDQAYLEEVAYLFNVYPLSRVLFLVTRRRPELIEKIEALARAHHIEKFDIATAATSRIEAVTGALKERCRNIGLLVAPKAASTGTGMLNIGTREKKRFLWSLSALAGCPILLAAGTFPYTEVAVPCLDRAELTRALETTMEMASAINYQITPLLVRQSPYIAGAEEAKAFSDMKQTVMDLSLIYKTKVSIRELEGNPIRAVGEALADASLLVTDMSGWHDSGMLRELFRPDIGWSIVRLAPTSTLLIPQQEQIA